MFCNIHTLVCAALALWPRWNRTYFIIVLNSQIKAISELLDIWWNTDQTMARALKKNRHQHPGCVLPPRALSWIDTVITPSHRFLIIKGKWINRRAYQKGLIGETGGELNRCCADCAEPSKGNIREPSPPHTTAVVGDFKCTSLMVIQTTSWKKKIKMTFVQL